jgi:RimJ/RimL family protein N-acetyltransferase
MPIKRSIVINCDGFILRKWLKKDISSLIENADNRNIWINLKDLFPAPYTREDANKWIDFTASAPVNTLFAIIKDSKAIGGIGIHFFDDVHKHSAEIGYWLGENYWGKGIATEAVSKFVSFIFVNFDINRIFARVFGWNLSSARVLEKNGFKLEGNLRKHIFKNGLYTDESIYGLLKEEYKP